MTATTGKCKRCTIFLLYCYGNMAHDLSRKLEQTTTFGVGHGSGRTTCADSVLKDSSKKECVEACNMRHVPPRRYSLRNALQKWIPDDRLVLRTGSSVILYDRYSFQKSLCNMLPIVSTCAPLLLHLHQPTNILLVPAHPLQTGGPGAL